MRPRTLELEGFTAFRQRTVLDFTSLDLFAITGPTGAGKSSLIDAICYALYGRVPRVMTEVASCISQGLDRMQVTLVFDALGERFRVYRETRRKGQGNVRFEIFEDNDWRPVADRSKDVTKRIEEVVGLDYEAFIRSALLPQGQFQEFLAGSPERRRDVLRRLLRLEVYEKMRSRAGQEATSLKQQADAIERRLRDELADATPLTLAERKSRLQSAEHESIDLAESINALQQGLEAAKQAQAAREELARQTGALEALTARLDQGRSIVAGGADRITELEAIVEQFEAALAHNTYNDELFAALTGAANLALANERLAKSVRDARTNAVTAEKQLATAVAASKTAQAQLVQAQAAVVAAEAAVDEERRHDLAAALQAGLHPGDACPVCGGTIGTLTIAVAGKLDDATRALQAARKTEAALRDTASKALTQAALVENSLAGLRKTLDENTKQLSADQAKLAAALPAVEDLSSASIQRLLAAQREEREEHVRLSRDITAARTALTTEQRAVLTAQRDLAALEAEHTLATAALERATVAASATAESLAALIAANDWSITGSDFVRPLDALLGDTVRRHSAVQQEVGALQEQIRQLDADIELAATLRAQHVDLKQQYDVAADLAQLLSANRFQTYIQSEALRSLAEDGSRQLMTLSAGRYELEVATAGQDFVVRDKWNADEQRSVRTLSGGETFLASLALALSLAQSLPGLAPGRRIALDSIFLDEGFGSLDPEALDRAADALDSLRIENRLVCVITHLKELAERLPVHVIVNKAEEGSTIAVV